MQEILSSKSTCASTIMEVELYKCVSLDNLIQQNVTEATSLNKELDVNQSALVKNSEVIKCDDVFKETKNSLSLVEPNPVLLQSESPTDYSKISNTPELSDLPLCNPKRLTKKKKVLRNIIVVEEKEELKLKDQIAVVLEEHLIQIKLIELMIKNILILEIYLAINL
ncbi:hypothetical protein CEXT_454661 [Caerostris extrusa]|uniref:Uncharacterized protein n=1 Tax=Caerostris extrusa TaxID=172846 RepID=A0AAV4N788_CAEEX|nr:hypothetical protein CEXT_454661 [Caerostris extrusa]